MTINFDELGLKKYYLYEILATTFSKSKKILIPNTACMGIRLIENDTIKILPYKNTKSYKNLKNFKFISLNFVENIYLYALAALKNPKSKIGLVKFPEKFYLYYELDKFNEIKESSNDINNSDKIIIPYINEAWATLICTAIHEKQIIKKDRLGESLLAEFKLKVISLKKYKESHKLFNRAENLALESIVIATRLKSAYYRKEYGLISNYKDIIDENFNNVKRFGRNPNVLKTFDLVKKYINNFIS